MKTIPEKKILFFNNARLGIEPKSTGHEPIMLLLHQSAFFLV